MRQRLTRLDSTRHFYCGCLIFAWYLPCLLHYITVVSSLVSATVYMTTTFFVVRCCCCCSTATTTTTTTTVPVVSYRRSQLTHSKPSVCGWLDLPKCVSNQICRHDDSSDCLLPSFLLSPSCCLRCCRHSLRAVLVYRTVCSHPCVLLLCCYC